ncbi:MAG: hypothetical protein GX328_01760 [Clostridiaceae bacterium]|nr:hypothetical protein [Clostridiaceae bacterium]
MKSNNSDNSNLNNQQNFNTNDSENNQMPIRIRRINIPEMTSETISIDSEKSSEFDISESVIDQDISEAVIDQSAINLSENENVQLTHNEQIDNIDQTPIIRKYLSDHQIDIQSNEIQSNEIQSKPLKINPVGSNGNLSNDDTIINESAIRLDTRSLKKYLKPADKIDSPNTKQNIDLDKPWEIDRKNGSKVYELIGYTTLSKIQHGIKKDNRQSLLKRILITLMLFVIIFIILYAMNPIKDLIDFKRIIGIESMYGEDYGKKENHQESINSQEQTNVNDNSTDEEITESNPD